MIQLRIELQQLISTMEDHHDLEIPFLFSKLDIKDGFWTMAVINEDVWNFCYVLFSFTFIDSIYDI